MALTDITSSHAALDETADRASFGPLLKLVFGAALVLASLALWLVPGAAIAPSLLMMKLGLSIGLMTFGLGMFSAALENRP